MGQALYRKYRSKSLGEILGQEHITKTLEQALKSGRISHAYLFTGPRGVGKTSIARILAHEVNGLPYTDDSSHIDIIEIDAASNRRIDEIRELREKVYVAPTSAKYKVYIIDEVHMLTREAFNALLKTLEEPPAHVIFILATTDAHKLPETIISRTQRFTFKPAEPAKVKSLLAEIAKKEGIEISNEALELLAVHGAGSFRDSVSLFDQVSGSGKEVTASDVLNIIGIPPLDALVKLYSDIVEHYDPSILFQDLSKLYGQGYQATTIAKLLGQTLRGQLINGEHSMQSSQIIELLRNLLEVPTSTDPERLLEIVLLEAVVSQTGEHNNKKPSPATVNEHNKVPEPLVAPPKPKAAESIQAQETPKPALEVKEIEQEQVIHKEKVRESNAKNMAQPEEALPLDTTTWPDILKALKKKHNTLYGVARMAQPEFTDDSLKLLFSFPFHQKRLNEAKNRQLLAEVIEQVTGKHLLVECLVDKSAKPHPAEPPETPTIQEVSAKTNPSTELVTISNIFGGGELLES